MVLNVEPESLFAGTAAKPIDPRYTNELKEVLNFTNQILAYRDRKVNEYVQIILDTYCIPPRHPEQFKLKDGIRAIILDSEMDDISSKLSELLTPYSNVTHNQPDTVPFTWRGVTPDYQHKSLRSKGADIRQSLRSRGFDDENVVRVMCAYYDHFKVFWWREHHLPTLDALLRDAAPEVMPKPLSDWRLYNDSDNHPAQLSIEAGTIVDSLMEASVSERDAVRALNYYWDKHCITGWRENKIDQYIADIKKMIAQETQS